MTISGGRNDTIMNNNFVHNGSWGALFVPFPDTDTPPAGVTCAGSGGTDFSSLGFGCVYDTQNDALLSNTFSQNGFFGNPTNGDYGQITLTGGHPQNCFAGNVTASGTPASGTPSNLEQTQPTCGATTAGANTGGPLFNEVLCASGLAGPGFCSGTDNYPRSGTVTLKPAAPQLADNAQPVRGRAEQRLVRVGPAGLRPWRPGPPGQSAFYGSWLPRPAAKRERMTGQIRCINNRWPFAAI